MEIKKPQTDKELLEKAKRIIRTTQKDLTILERIIQELERSNNE